MVCGTDKRAEADCAAQNLLRILTSSQMTGSDLEYVESDGTVHMARFVPDTKINAMFQLAQDTSEVVDTTVSKMTGQPIQLAIVHPGQFDQTVFWLYLAQRTVTDQATHHKRIAMRQAQVFN